MSPKPFPDSISKVWKPKSKSRNLKAEVQSEVSFEADRSGTPLEADYGISKVQNLEADWYFEGPEFRGRLVF
ncbi:hypothetical protein RclHR1_29570001 [Rhizophagus clarus]|uniref:Uncharacterized protein n=1 Tax=Rhizophagus clarus TaxID=94130 RepID=A0A2Z6RKQ1_9GLOM|nr:hypothetical protein RclHR1_29570001 [Rhizophagus clarus]